MYDVWADPRPCALTPQESIACLSLVCVGLCWEVVFADALTRISSHTREIHTTCLDPRSMDLGIAPTRLSARLPGGGEGWGEQLANSTLILVKPVGTKRPPENPKPSALKRRNAKPRFLYRHLRFKCCQRTVFPGRSGGCSGFTGFGLNLET